MASKTTEDVALFRTHDSSRTVQITHQAMDRSVEKTISAADIIDRNQIDGLAARPPLTTT